jgi:hypothetical protein
MDPVSVAEEERLKAIIRAGKLAQMGVRSDAPPSVQEALAKVDALQAQRTPHALDGSHRARTAFDRAPTVLPRGLVMKAPTQTDWAVAGAGATNAADFAARHGVFRRA